MSEQKIPAEMLDAATRAVGEYLTSLCIDDVDELAIAEVALRAAGVPELVARIADAEQEMTKVREVLHDHSVYFEAELKKREERIAELEAELGEANLIAEARSVVGMDLLAEADQQEARIAELEVALDGRICEGCNALMTNVGMLHLCGCEDQRNLCSACKAGCACAGGE